MANPISAAIGVGTIGELLVQLRLLQYGVQAAPPIKDSGNDLIAFMGEVMRTVQVKTCANGVLPAWPEPRKIYHLLAVVRLKGEDDQLLLDETDIYLIPKRELPTLGRNWDAIELYRLSSQHLFEIFRE